MNTQKQSRGRGRPEGETFTGITLEELNKKFAPDQVIPVGRLFIERGYAKTKSQVFSVKNGQPPKVEKAPAATAPEGAGIDMQLQD